MMVIEVIYVLVACALLTFAVALAVDTWLKYKDGVK